MSGSVGGSVERVRAALAAAGHPDTITAFPDGTRTAADAAAAVGCDVAQIAKSIVFRAGERAAVIVTSGANRVDAAKVAALLGVAVKRADADFVRDYILKPAGIYRMQPGASLLSGRLPDEVKYYDYPGAPLVGSAFPPLGALVPEPYGGFSTELMLANGGWIASTVDLLRYADNINGQLSPGILQFPPSGFVSYVSGDHGARHIAL